MTREQASRVDEHPTVGSIPDYSNVKNTYQLLFSTLLIKFLHFQKLVFILIYGIRPGKNCI